MDQPGQPQLIKFLPQKLSYTFLKKNVFQVRFQELPTKFHRFSQKLIF